jgi:hypothetical protein
MAMGLPPVTSAVLQIIIFIIIIIISPLPTTSPVLLIAK